MEKLELNIFEKIQEIVNKKIMKKPTEEEIGGFSMNEGEHEKIFGFRREIVRGVVIFFGSVLILAFILRQMKKKKSRKKQKQYQ